MSFPSTQQSKVLSVEDDKNANEHIYVESTPNSTIVKAPQDEGSGLVALVRHPRILGITFMATLGGFLFGYDQGVVGNVLVLESFGAKFPQIYMDSSLKGWFVSTLLLGAWFGSLINGPFCDKFGRRRCIMFHVVLFLLGSGLQTGATTEGHLFGGRAVAGVAIGALTHVVPMYIAEIAPSNLRGGLVACQQLSITLGILFSYWIAYGTSHIGGTRCAPDTPYTGPLLNGNPTFDAYTDVPLGGCTGQTQAAWRIPVGIQLLPAIVLGVGMFWMPYSPRWLTEVGRDEEAQETLSSLRKLPVDSEEVRHEFLEIKAEIMIVREIRESHSSGRGILGRLTQPYVELVSTRANFHRLAIGCLVMFYQQFIGCNAIIYYAPTIFAQLGLDPNTTSLLATGCYGIVNTVFTLPAVFFIDRVGRRPLLMAGAVGCFTSLIVVGSLIAAYGHDWPAHATDGRVAIAFVYIYDVNFSYSWAPIGWILPSEVFNLATRSTGISITTSTTWMSNFIIGVVSPIMLSNLAHGGTYFFFAGFAVLGFLTTFFFVPETRMKTLEEMNVVFKDISTTSEVAVTARIRQELGLAPSDECLTLTGKA